MKMSASNLSLGAKQSMSLWRPLIFSIIFQASPLPTTILPSGSTKDSCVETVLVAFDSIELRLLTRQFCVATKVVLG